MTLTRWSLLIGLVAGVFLTMLIAVAAGMWLPGTWSCLSFMSGMVTMAIVIWAGLAWVGGGR